MTEKHQYLIWGARGQSPALFASAIYERAVPPLSELGSFRIKATITDSPPPLLSLFPFRRRPVALLSLWGEQLPSPQACSALLERHGERLAGYRVAESLPVAYDRDWPEGQKTPGVSLLTLFRQRPDIDQETFLRRWHGGHSALTLRVHPVWCYVRNVVEEPLIDGSPPFDGIVEEHFRQAEDLLDPRRFFGGTASMVPNMARVALDIRRFMDLGTMETYLASETCLRDAPLSS